MDENVIPKFIFIVPYRNRVPQQNHFKIYMKYILEDIPEENYKIFYIHQNDARPFNRGAMKNIGFIAMRNKYPNDYKNISFIFNDIDTIPSFKNLFDYETTNGTIKHFYGYTNTLGGIVSIKGADFEKINGYPNYWGWGHEDNDLQIRATLFKINIDRSKFFTYDNPTIININSNPKRVYSKEQIWKIGPNNNEGIIDIKNLNYEYEGDMINVMNFITRYNYESEHFYENYANPKVFADIRYKPPNSLNSVNFLQKAGITITNNNGLIKNAGSRGVGMKLF